MKGRIAQAPGTRLRSGGRSRTARGRIGCRAILASMHAHFEIAELIEPLRADPANAAILLDIDGTLAPIVRHASDASVPEPTRRTLIAIAKTYGFVACVSGRPAVVARQMVSIGS